MIPWLGVKGTATEVNLIFHLSAVKIRLAEVNAASLMNPIWKQQHSAPKMCLAPKIRKQVSLNPPNLASWSLESDERTVQKVERQAVTSRKDLTVV